MTKPTPAQASVEAVLYARFDPAWGRMMLCERGQFGAVEYRLASPPPTVGAEDEAVVKEVPWGGVTHAQIEELADRLMGCGMNGLTTDDWPTLVNILEAASFLRAREGDHV